MKTDKKMITYVLTVSEKFPATHKRAGEETKFFDSIFAEDKTHTIRGNFPLWAKRFEKIKKGEACLSIRVWSGKPYASRQVEKLRLDHRHDIGIQPVRFNRTHDGALLTPSVSSLKELAINDGLEFPDFIDWFKKVKNNDVMVIIHFTKFRYSVPK